MRHAVDFTAAVRSGRRAGGRSLVVHLLARPSAPDATFPIVGPPIVGLVVSKAVGGSVARHRVARRLRAQLAGRLDRLPPGSSTVVRALPPSADASSSVLGSDLDRALDRLVRPVSAGTS